VGARAAVEIGTGAGVSSVWLLRGMQAGGVLTSVDVEAEHQRLARETLADAGYPPARVRLIGGNASDVLPRLTDGGYDLVFCDTRPRDYAGYLGEALRLLRPGGVVALGSVLRGRVAEPGARDADSVALRQLLAQVRDDERLVPVLLPVDAGLLAAVRV
jgi:predicted O-methyltransferase YrrM